jgi:hypothetical protein
MREHVQALPGAVPRIDVDGGLGQAALRHPSDSEPELLDLALAFRVVGMEVAPDA